MWVCTSKSWFLLNLSPLYKVTSKDVSSVSLDSYINLIVGCIWLMLVINVVNSDVDLVQITKMLAMNHFHNIICCLLNSFSFSSSFPMNRFAYVGAILVPIAVPWICR